MKVFPPIIKPGTSPGESFVFRLIERCELGCEYCAYHSLLLPKHRKKLIGETDFLIMTPEGFILLEVKGGVMSIDENGIWTQGAKQLKESPLHQADGNMFAVKDELVAASMPFKYRENLLGFGIIFPECMFNVNSIETADCLIMDQTGLLTSDPIKHFIGRLEKFWRNKIGGSARRFSADEQVRIRHWLRPQFHGVVSLKSDFTEIKDKMVALLDDQMDFLAIAQGKKRGICRGGAGTGKTLVGLEYTRIKVEEGCRAAFVVPNPILKAYLQSHGYSDITILTMDDLTKAAERSFDVLVADEVQDMMCYDAMDVVDKALVDGIEKGSWLLFMDHQNQSGIDGTFDCSCHQYVCGLAEFDFPLPRNIRNTIEIIAETKKLTARDIGKKGTGKGSVKYLEYGNDNELSIKLGKHLTSLRVCDVTPEMIAVIGVQSSNQSKVVSALQLNNYRVEELNSSTCRTFPPKSNKVVTFSDYKNFKGLESYIVIVDIADFGVNALSSPMFYVAITRAVGHLILVYPKTMRSQIAELQQKNATLIKEQEAAFV